MKPWIKRLGLCHLFLGAPFGLITSLYMNLLFSSSQCMEPCSIQNYYSVFINACMLFWPLHLKSAFLTGLGFWLMLEVAFEIPT